MPVHVKPIEKPSATLLRKSRVAILKPHKEITHINVSSLAAIHSLEACFQTTIKVLSELRKFFHKSV
jgi:hypothetical protein